MKNFKVNKYGRPVVGREESLWGRMGHVSARGPRLEPRIKSKEQAKNMPDEKTMDKITPALSKSTSTIRTGQAQARVGLK